MRKTRQEAYREVLKNAKRIALTILCCLPVLIIFGYLTREIITNSAIQILIFVLFMGAVVLIEELIHWRNKKKKQANLTEEQDVFK